MARRPAGEVVVEVEGGGRVALALGQAEDGLRRVEEDVGVGAAAVEVEEVEVELLALGGAMREAVRCDQSEVLVLVHLVRVGEEDGDASDEEGLGQALDDGLDEGAEVGLGVETAAELDEGFAVVETLLVEDAIHAALDEALERIEEQAGDDDGGDEAPGAEARELGVYELGGKGDDAKVEADQGGGRERVGDAALEDEVDVHEAVTDDGPTEGERKQDQRKDGEAREVVGRGGVREERDDVEGGEGQDREQRSAGEPLELLALQGVLFAAIAPPEDSRSHEVEDGEVGVVDLVETVDELAGGGPALLGEVAEDEQHRAGQVEQRIEEVAAGARLFVVGEADREVQEERGLESCGYVVAPQDPEVESVQLSGDLEGVEREGGQAEDVEVGGFRGRPAAEENVEADGEVDQRDEAEDLVVGTVVVGAGFEDDLDGEGGFLAVGGGAGNGVFCGGKDAAPIDGADGVGEVGGRLAVDRDDDVAFADAGAVGGRSRGDGVDEEAAGGFGHAGAVGGGIEAEVLRQVRRRQPDNAQGEQGKQDGDETSWVAALHAGDPKLRYIVAFNST